MSLTYFSMLLDCFEYILAKIMLACFTTLLVFLNPLVLLTMLTAIKIQIGISGIGGRHSNTDAKDRNL